MVFIFCLRVYALKFLALGFLLIENNYYGNTAKVFKTWNILGLAFLLHFKDLEKSSNYIWRAPSMHEYPS